MFIEMFRRRPMVTDEDVRYIVEKIKSAIDK